MFAFLSLLPKRILILFAVGLVLFIVLLLSLFSSLGSGGGGKGTGPLDTKLLPSPTILLPPDVKKQPIRNVSFQLGNPSLPTTTNVYTIAGYVVDQTWAQAIAKTFGLEQSPKRLDDISSGTILLWNSDDQTFSLSVALGTGYLEYTTYHEEQGFLPSNIPSPEDLTKTADDFLKTHGLHPQNIGTSTSNIRAYLSHNGQVGPTTDRSKANIYAVEFNRQLDGLIIQEQYGRKAPIVVWVDSKLSVNKVSFQYPQINLTSKTPVPLLSLNEAKAKISKGEGNIVNFEPGAIDPKSVNAATSIVLTKVAIRYFDDKVTKVLQPIFVFEGVGDYPGFPEQDVVIYLPAIKT